MCAALAIAARISPSLCASKRPSAASTRVALALSLTRSAKSAYGISSEKGSGVRSDASSGSAPG